jgi:2,4-dienoyl-CoA reductase-like NADH-dependent reductase (Old Yellow Enzyme family)
MPTLCLSFVPVVLGDKWLDKLAIQSLIETSKAVILPEIDEATEDWKRGAPVAKTTGFKEIQLHGAHGFLLCQFLSPLTNRRTDAYDSPRDE